MPNPSMGLNNLFFSSKPVDTTQFSTIKQLSSNCWINNNDQIDCFNRNIVPEEVFSLTEVKQLSQGYESSCVLLKTSEQVKCWGQVYTNPNGLNEIVDLDRAKKINMGFGHACALEVSGTVKCWLSGAFFNVAESNLAKPILRVSKAIDLASNQGASCAVIEDGRVKCWGEMFTDQPSRTQVTAIEIEGISDAKSVFGNMNSRSFCAITKENRVKCWGDNYDGILGRGTDIEKDLNADYVVGVSGVKKIVMGGSFNCVLGLNGHVKCWGSNLSYVINRNPNIGKYALAADTSLSDKQVVDLFVSGQGLIFIFADGTRGFVGSINTNRTILRPNLVFMHSNE